MKRTLELGIGSNLEAWLEAVYKDPVGKIQVNNETPGPIQIARGVRQGCPLSPLLFDICIEAVAIAVRQEDSIPEFVVKGKEFKLVRYADDTVFFLTNPIKSLPLLLHKISTYTKLSGYKINQTKSEIMPLNIPEKLKEKLA